MLSWHGIEKPALTLRHQFRRPAQPGADAHPVPKSAMNASRPDPQRGKNASV